MEIINLPQINLAQLQTLSESVIKITKPLPELAPEVQAVQETFKTFEKGMIKSSSTSNKKTLDRSRDLINTGFFKSVDAEEQFP
ncbi:hypothetical protein N6H18_18440 [Reichenbachiella agarivorans]|uniref:Fic/DOC family N-terminal n=1 Tax=Reichenbachiella agarivorans TaxID=2979464 RepID=A0ABY6CP63_9BACT|nr:hypothetical protein [Reichenbachiella agarivorans]UXP32321.1 hypothetical protein N6H18_18440 [Reichenbachiella agarivorans]